MQQDLSKEIDRIFHLVWILCICTFILSFMLGAFGIYAIMPKVDLPEEHKAATPQDKFKCRLGEDKVWHVEFDNDANHAK